MKVILDIEDSKAAFVMELLKNFKFIKTKTLTPYKAEILEGIKEAVEEINLIKEGKLEGKPARDLLNEL